jgi:hypothetical protein
MSASQFENEGFMKYCSFVFTNQKEFIFHQKLNQLATFWYDLNAEFFINPQKNIAYMIGKLENKIIRLPLQKNKKIEEEIREKLSKQLNEVDSRILAYSVCKDGKEVLEVLTAYLAIEEQNALFGRNLEVPDQIKVKGSIIRNITENDLDKVLRSHKTYIENLEVLNGFELAERLLEKCLTINYSFFSNPDTCKIN